MRSSALDIIPERERWFNTGAQVRPYTRSYEDLILLAFYRTLRRLRFELR